MVPGAAPALAKAGVGRFLSVCDALGKTGIEGSRKERHCLERLRKDVAEIVLVDLYLLGSDVGPLWSQGLEGISVSIGGLRCDCGRKDLKELLSV